MMMPMTVMVSGTNEMDTVMSRSLTCLRGSFRGAATDQSRSGRLLSLGSRQVVKSTKSLESRQSTPSLALCPSSILARHSPLLYVPLSAPFSTRTRARPLNKGPQWCLRLLLVAFLLRLPSRSGRPVSIEHYRKRASPSHVAAAALEAKSTRVGLRGP